MLSPDVVEYFTGSKNEPMASRFFLKALFTVALVNLISLWVAADVVLEGYSKSAPDSLFSRIIMSGSTLAAFNSDLFFGAFAVFLIAALLLRPDYRINIIFFWFELNYFRVLYPITNGSDFVMLALALLAIPLASRPGYASPHFQFVGNTLFNCFRILIKIQVLSIYLISGWDKLKSPVWRSGDAFEYIANLDMVFNPAFASLMTSEAAQLTLSWMTIIFELIFIALVWFRRTRLPILATGVVFHIVIWLMLGLADFAWVMIMSYAIFLKDRDFDPFLKRIRPAPL